MLLERYEEDLEESARRHAAKRKFLDCMRLSSYCCKSHWILRKFARRRRRRRPCLLDAIEGLHGNDETAREVKRFLGIVSEVCEEQDAARRLKRYPYFWGIFIIVVPSCSSKTFGRLPCTLTTRAVMLVRYKELKKVSARRHDMRVHKRVDARSFASIIR